jgi:Zn-dependent protease with chaperone function
MLEQTQSGATPDAMAALFLDGTSNRKHRVVLRLDGDLGIVADGNLIASWPYADIRRADGPPGVTRLGCTIAPPLARLEIADPETAGAVLARCPALDVGRSGAGSALRIIGWSIAAAASILAVAVFGVPLLADRLAPLIPPTVESRIGDVVDRHVRATFKAETCKGEAGQAAFRALVEKLRVAGGVEVPFQAEVLSSTTPNAVALPGGKIYVFDGLLQRARNADELAGVVAHEIGHIQNRDNLRKILQNSGTAFLVGLLFGDVMGGTVVISVAGSVLSASYSRDAERRADAFTIELMHKLGRSPTPMGELLFRVTGAEKGKSASSATILSSHPLTEERRDVMQKAGRPVTGPELLTAAEWDALKVVCKAR